MTDTTLTLVPLREKDRDAWAPLWAGYQAFYKASIAPEVTELSWVRLLDPAEPVNGFLAWRDGRAIGVVHFIWHRSTWTSGDYCYLQDLFVADAARGGGVGRQLIEAVYAAAVAKDCSRVYWLTHETNSEAMQLYDRISERSGFIQYRKSL